MKPTCIELFSGCGIAALGIEKAGFEIVHAFDINPKAVEMYNSSGVLDPVAQVADLSTVDWDAVNDSFTGRLDLLAGGPVCKAFSPGGTRFGSNGQWDDRNTWPLATRALEALKPRYAIFENSFGMARTKHAEYVTELQDTFSELGYSSSVHLVDCHEYGVPQHRKRLVFLLSAADVPMWHARRDSDGRELRHEDLPYRATVGQCLQRDEDLEGPMERLLFPMTPKARRYYLKRDKDGKQVHVKKHRPLRMAKPATAVVSVYKKGVPYGVVQGGVLEDGDPRDVYYLAAPRLVARLMGLPDDYELGHVAKTHELEALGNGFPPQVMFSYLAWLYAYGEFGGAR